MEQLSVLVVQGSVFDIAIVQVVLWHGDLHTKPACLHADTPAVQAVMGHSQLCAVISGPSALSDAFPEHASREHVASVQTSGPLNTLGSFMSFQTYRLGVEPLYLDRENCPAHHSLTAGFSMSR